MSPRYLDLSVEDIALIQVVKRGMCTRSASRSACMQTEGFRKQQKSVARLLKTISGKNFSMKEELRYSDVYALEVTRARMRMGTSPGKRLTRTQKMAKEVVAIDNYLLSPPKGTIEQQSIFDHFLALDEQYIDLAAAIAVYLDHLPLKTKIRSRFPTTRPYTQPAN